MYGYLLWACTVALWWLDPTLLMKFQNFTRKQLISIAMNAIELYSDMTHNKRSREMIKDGYHVDFVYLIIEQHNRVRKVDVTSIFRREVLNGTFDNPCSIEAFVQLCCSPNSNLKFVNSYNDDYKLELNYTYDHKHYTVWFSKDTNSNIIFPIYTEKHLKSIITLPRILSAILQKQEGGSGIDVTQEINNAAGPMGNFYDDIDNIVVLKKWVFPDDSNLLLTIIDHNAQIHTFDKSHKILTLNNNIE